MKKPPSKEFKITVSEPLQKERLDVFLSHNLPDISRSLARKIIADGHCLINNKPVNKPSTFVQLADDITVHVPEISTVSLKPQNLPLDIVYEDEHIVVINKTFGMVVHPSAGHIDNTLVNALLYHCKSLSQGSHEHRPGIVHRLDKDTGGLIVVAKTQVAHEHLAKQFKNKTAGRIYIAMTYGAFKDQQGTFENHLIRHPKNRLKYIGTQDTHLGKRAKTHYEALVSGPISYVKLKLETGRTHQIRVHLSENSNPIVNDVIYGNDSFLKNIKDPRLKSMIKNSGHMFLFAKELNLLHPITQSPLHFEVELPKSFMDLIELIHASQ